MFYNSVIGWNRLIGVLTLGVNVVPEVASQMKHLLGIQSNWKVKEAYSR